MPKTTIDFETRSHVDLKKRGVAIYAMHPSTDALCLAYKTPAGMRQWVWDPDDINPIPEDLLRLIEAGEVHAFNAPFERYIWQYVMVRKHGWPDIPLERYRCTLAKAAHANQPQSLDKLGERLGLGPEAQKNKQGKDLIRLISVPKKPKKKKGQSAPTGLEFYPWSERDQKCNEYLDYNRQDVVAEDAADEVLPEWTPAEIAIWQMDRRINERGFYIDQALCRGAVAIHAEAKARANARITELTEGKVTACTQVQRIKKWIEEDQRVNLGPSLDEDHINIWLRKNPAMKTSPTAQVLRLRLAVNSNAVAKFNTALMRVCEDGRVRESLRYYKAATGRWAGSGFHPHTLNRDATEEEAHFEILTRGDYDECEMVHGTDLETEGTIGLMKQCVRGIITAPPGHKLVVSDFAGIEARFLQWLVGNKQKIQMFLEDQDVYIAAACDIYKCKPEDIATWTGKKWKIKDDEKLKRQLGKVAELALGYGMGAAKFMVYAENQNIDVDAEFAEEIVTTWRSANPLVTSLWAQVNRHAQHVTNNKFTNGAPTRTRLGRIEFGYDMRKYLYIRLPSGRRLYYFQPHMLEENGWKELHYLDGSKQDKKYASVKTYGGKLVENIVQAGSRDLLCHSAQLIDRAGFRIIFTVHDEVVVECEDERVDECKRVVHTAMSTVPKWATGLPLSAETKVSQRYGK